MKHLQILNGEFLLFFSSKVPSGKVKCFAEGENEVEMSIFVFKTILQNFENTFFKSVLFDFETILTMNLQQLHKSHSNLSSFPNK